MSLCLSRDLISLASILKRGLTYLMHPLCMKVDIIELITSLRSFAKEITVKKEFVIAEFLCFAAIELRACKVSLI